MEKSSMEQRQKRQKKKLLQCLKDCVGLISNACTKANISRGTYYNWYRSDPEFKAKADEIKELTDDFFEAALIKKVQDGDTAAIIFCAKTRLKHRGYSERFEITGADGGDVLVNHKVDIDSLTDEQRNCLLTIGLSELDSTDEFLPN